MEASKFGIATNPAALSKNPEWKNTILPSFEYRYENEGNKGYSVFLSLSDGSILNVQVCLICLSYMSALHVCR